MPINSINFVHNEAFYLSIHRHYDGDRPFEFPTRSDIQPDHKFNYLDRRTPTSNGRYESIVYATPSCN